MRVLTYRILIKSRLCFVQIPAYQRGYVMDLSSCCKAPVRVEGGMPEDQDEGTRYYICERCSQPCNLQNLENLMEDK